jgi:CRP-like cAMP-binding protein
MRLLLQTNMNATVAMAMVRLTGLLGRLSERDQADLRPFLEPFLVTRGTILSDVADEGDYIFFPQGPLVSVRHGPNVEIGLVGSEGLVGWSALVGCNSSSFRAVVCGREGCILRVRTDQLRTLIAARPSLGLLLSRYVNAIGIQMAETIGAGASHRLELRLARWILLRHDRMSGDEIPVHHDDIALNLGTRRASITDTLHILEGAGYIRGRRGRLIVRDRTGLESLAGDCYGASESFYRTVIGVFGKTKTVSATTLRGDQLPKSGPPLYQPLL